MPLCEIIYIKSAKGWQWRSLSEPGKLKQTSGKTYPLFYECVTAARSKGYNPNVKCL